MKHVSLRMLIVIAIFSTILCVSCDSNNSGKNQSINRFTSGIIKTLNGGYTDSIFIAADGNRIYFLNSVLCAYDFLNGTITHAVASFLPNHTGSASGVYWNSDLYYIEWNGQSWSDAINLGSKINSLGNEGCVWLNDDETIIIFYRDNLSLTGIGDTGNYQATRTDKNATWSDPVLLPGKYGSENQSPPTKLYRHDIQLTTSGDLYLWESQDGVTKNNILLYGKKNGTGWDPPVAIAGTHGDSSRGETQLWVSRDETKLIFNRRGADANTTLKYFSRVNITDTWSNETNVPLNGFADSAGLSVWGEPTFTSSETFMLFIRFDTSVSSWPCDIMYADGNFIDGYGPPVKLN